MIGALLSLLRRVPGGRQPTACWSGANWVPRRSAWSAWRRRRARWRRCSAASARRVVGYDPSLHASDSVWERWRVEPLGLRELLEQADAVCVQLSYFSRYQGLLGERFLPFCKPNQVIVSIAHSALFDEAALAEALGSGPHRSGLARQPGARRARQRPAAGRHRHAADHAARREHDARVAPAQRLGGRAPHRRAAERDARAQCASSGRRCQACQLISQPVPCRRELGEALALLIDHRGGRAGHERLVGELGLGLRRSRRRGGRFPWSGARVSAATSISTCSARRVSPRTATGAAAVAAAKAASSANTLHVRQLRQRLQHRRGRLDEARHRRSPAAAPRCFGATGSSRCAACGRRRPGPSASRPRRRRPGRRARAAPAGRSRRRCRRATVPARHAARPLPQLGGDERRDRVQQAQHGLEHADQRAARCALLGSCRSGRLGELHLRDLDVPVAVLVPDEGVDRVGDVVEPVVGEALLDRGLDALQLAADPAVGRREAACSRANGPARARTRPWCAPSARSPDPRSSSARTWSRSRACCRSCGSPRSAWCRS